MDLSWRGILDFCDKFVLVTVLIFDNVYLLKHYILLNHYICLTFGYVYSDKLLIGLFANQELLSLQLALQRSTCATLRTLEKMLSKHRGVTAVGRSAASHWILKRKRLLFFSTKISLIISDLPSEKVEAEHLREHLHEYYM